jgi:hypothetical protein
MIPAHFDHLIIPLVPERRVAMEEKDVRPLANLYKSNTIHLSTPATEDMRLQAAFSLR